MLECLPPGTVPLLASEAASVHMGWGAMVPLFHHLCVFLRPALELEKEIIQWTTPGPWGLSSFPVIVQLSLCVCGLTIVLPLCLLASLAPACGCSAMALFSVHVV